MTKLIIAPLATPNSITVAAKDAILGAKKLFLQTAFHPCAKWILNANLEYESMDRLYSQCEDFDEMNEAIAEALLCGEDDAVFAVPGRGAGCDLLKRLTEKAKAKEVEIVHLPSSGYAEGALHATPLHMNLGNIRIVPANELPKPIDVYTPLCVEEIDTSVRASEVKLALMEYYPDEFPVYLCRMDEHGDYNGKQILLFELDHQEGFFAATTLILRAARFEELDRFGLNDLMRVMATLRAPGGCPWDREQTHASLKTSLLEESYEVLDAIDAGDMDMLCEELGDFLLQAAFHAQIAQEHRTFTMRDVLTGIVNKLIYRHPHVFAEAHVSNSAEVVANWEKLKQTEKQQQSVAHAMRSMPKGFPALISARKVQKKAASVGFDWNSADEAFLKIVEETQEFKQAMMSREANSSVYEELGDLLFSVVNVARLLNLDAELALKSATDKFAERFAHMEEMIVSSGNSLEKMTLDEMDCFWNMTKIVTKV